MRRAALVVLCVALAGCERGCLARWLSGDGEGMGSPERSPGESRRSALDLTGTDCSDGLLRCQQGQVEASRVAHVSARCGEGQSPEKKASECTCPWDVVLSCACAIEGVEISATIDAGARQLCRPSSPVARPVLGSDDASVNVCAEEGTSCREGIVRLCDAPAAVSRPVAYCIFGCATGVQVVETEDGPGANLDGVISILCRRGDAERR